MDNYMEKIMLEIKNEPRKVVEALLDGHYMQKKGERGYV
jgi:hypothetical protein